MTLARLNTHGVFLGSEELIVFKGKSFMGARVRLARCKDGWRYSTSYQLPASGRTSPICEDDPAYSTRRGALLHGLLDLKAYMRDEVQSQGPAHQKLAAQILAAVHIRNLDALASQPAPFDPEDEDDNDFDPDDPIDVAAGKYVNTSVQDCDSSLRCALLNNHAEREVIERALELSELRGHKARIPILKRALRQLDKAAA